MCHARTDVVAITTSITSDYVGNDPLIVHLLSPHYLLIIIEHGFFPHSRHRTFYHLRISHSLAQNIPNRTSTSRVQRHISKQHLKTPYFIIAQFPVHNKRRC